jgi:hypothetical protein
VLACVSLGIEHGRALSEQIVICVQATDRTDRLRLIE